MISHEGIVKEAVVSHEAQDYVNQNVQQLNTLFGANYASYLVTD